MAGMRARIVPAPSALAAILLAASAYPSTALAAPADNTGSGLSNEQAPPGAATYPSYATPLPPPPPPPKELAFALRFNPLDLVFGKANLEAEWAFWGPLSITVAPQYVFADPRQSSDYAVTAKGWGVFSQIGFWIDGRALRGYFIKLHVEHNEVTFKSPIEDLQVPETMLGIMFGQQSIHAGWFTFSTGLGVAYDVNSKERIIRTRSRSGTIIDYRVDQTGILNNGVDFLTQLAIGASF